MLIIPNRVNRLCHVLRNRNVGHVGRIVSNGLCVAVGPIPDAENHYEQFSVQSKLSQQRGHAMYQEKLRRRKRR